MRISEDPIHRKLGFREDYPSRQSDVFSGDSGQLSGHRRLKDAVDGPSVNLGAWYPCVLHRRIETLMEESLEPFL
jgi:hypothetical protein